VDAVAFGCHAGGPTHKQSFKVLPSRHSCPSFFLLLSPSQTLYLMTFLHHFFFLVFCLDFFLFLLFFCSFPSFPLKLGV